MFQRKGLKLALAFFLQAFAFSHMWECYKGKFSYEDVLCFGVSPW